MHKTKICRVCGKDFQPKSSRQLDCNRTIVKKCIVCGREFEGKCSKNDIRMTCSKECENKYALMRRNSSANKTTRYCKECGRLFHPEHPSQLYCKDKHYRKCIVCGKSYEIDVTKGKDIPKTCSTECYHNYLSQNCIFRDKQFRENALESYHKKTGYDHPMHNPDVIHKIQSTTLERYGNTSFRRTEEYAEKVKETSQIKYGTDHPLQSQEVRSKIAQTLLEEYGVENAFQSEVIRQRFYHNYEKKTGYHHPRQNPEVIKKYNETCVKLYGIPWAIASDVVRSKIETTLIQRYGFTNPMKNEEVHKKAEQTCLDKYGAKSYAESVEGKERLRNYMMMHYGVHNYNSTKESIESKMSDPSKIDEYMKFLRDPSEYLDSMDHQPTINELRQLLGVSSISDRIRQLGLQDKVRYTLSTMEDDVFSFITSLNCIAKRHNRNSIPPYELDISSDVLSVECDPTATHNSSIADPWGAPPKLPSYHKMKTDMCEEKGIFLFHIFGYEWTHKREIIESMIKNILGKCDQKIYARKCVVKGVDSNTATKFLNANHRQGAAGASVRLGLYYQGEIVSLMTFGKMRNTIGTSKNEDLSDCWELVRFCSKLNTSVVGGASKLFKHFIRTYDPVRIRSFSDRAHTRGTLYQKLGFTELRRSDPGYVWVDLYTDRAYNRYNTQKQNIRKFLHDDTLDLSKSEKQIMEEHDFVQVFDCGTITWEYV